MPLEPQELGLSNDPCRSTRFLLPYCDSGTFLPQRIPTEPSPDSIFGISAIDFMYLCKFPRKCLQLGSTVHRLSWTVLAFHTLQSSETRHPDKIHANCNDLV